MKHLTEEQLVEHYFADDADNRIAAETHLRICRRCEQAYEEISSVLALPTPHPPLHMPGFGRQLWKSIQAPLPAYPAKPRPNWFSMPRLVLAGACLFALVAAFIGGSLWQRARKVPIEAANPAQAKQRVVLFILDDHLDKSERLLVEISHAGADKRDPNDSLQADSLQAEARQLLPDNRLYRQALSSGNDPMMSAALDHLERVLLEVANSPDRLSSADIERIEREMNTDSLLFQVRVLRARNSSQETKVQSLAKGASI
jgi:hypothetical protein